MNPVKTIIFDLGGVLLDIDFKHTNNAFDKLGVHNFELLYSQNHADPFFEDFEKGKITPVEFYEKMRGICGCALPDDSIKDAWNALLVGFPPERLQWFDEISKKYKVYLFSNTNIIHYQWFVDHFKEVSGKNFNECFIKPYYSHEMGMRKPDPASFRFVVNEANLDPAETLFIDDTAGNIEAAKGVGLQTIHLAKPLTLLDLEL
jgi:FMN phosphatase YigB (HAD superfamily)